MRSGLVAQNYFQLAYRIVYRAVCTGKESENAENSIAEFI